MSKRTLAEKRKSTMKGQKQRIARDGFSHYTVNGQPKLTHLSEGSALAVGKKAYRCAQCGLWHSGGTL